MLVMIGVTVMALYGAWRFRIRNLEPPAFQAVENRFRDQGYPSPLSIIQGVPEKTPPFGGMPLQMRWDFSDLVCTGSATVPQHTGHVERIGCADRDQLVASVTLENCFKGHAPSLPVRVLGYSFIALRESGGGFAYSGPPPGFVEKGRNLFFLRKTGDPGVWDVTVPVYQVCIPLASTPPAYRLDSSPDSIRNALALEMEAAIVPYSKDTDQYLRYVINVLGRSKGLCELKRIYRVGNKDLQRQIALVLLWHDDQDGMDEAISMLRDSSLASWQRANAARALRNTTSLQARHALEQVIAGSNPDEVRTAARESLVLMGSR